MNKNKTFLIGLTGGIASGKSTTAKLFSNFDITVISADHIAKQLLSDNSLTVQKVVQKFGSSILDQNNEINRKKLRELIFSNQTAREQLNKITHPPIRKEMLCQASAAESDYVIIEIPLLIESGMQDMLDRVLVVHIEKNVQIERIMQRDNCSVAHAEAIINAQIDPDSRLQAADDVIHNDAGIHKLELIVGLLHNKYLEMSRQADKLQTGLDLH